MLLILTLRNPLVSVYAETGTEQILLAVEQYMAALRDVGKPVEFVLADNALSMAQLGLDPLMTFTPAALSRTIRELRARLSPVTAVLLLGGDRIVPYWRIFNPVTDRTIDPDPFVLSDNPYAANDDDYESWLAPELSIGRIPDGGAASAAEFIEFLRAAIENHIQRSPRSGSCAIVNEEWREVSIRAASTMPAPVDWHFAPSYLVSSDNAADLSRRWIFVNLHGFDTEPSWHGYDTFNDRFVAALTIHSFHSRSISGATVFCANCYGAQIAGKSTATSCALLALREGAASFVGSTGLAFGSFLNPGTIPIHSDRLASLFFENMASGESSGRSLQMARTKYLDEVDRDNPFEQKTALQFTLLGDPTLT